MASDMERSSPRSWCHFDGGHALARRAELVKKTIQAFKSVRGKLKGFRNGVDNPTEHAFAEGPMRVTLPHFLHGLGSLARWRVGRVKRAEDGVDGMQGVTKEAALLAPGLGGKQEVVDIDVNDRERFRADRRIKGCDPPHPTRQKRRARRGTSGAGVWATSSSG
jgi:hypothetical protein